MRNIINLRESALKQAGFFIYGKIQTGVYMRGTYTKRIQKLSDRLSDPALAEHARTIKNNKKQ